MRKKKKRMKRKEKKKERIQIEKEKKWKNSSNNSVFRPLYCYDFCIFNVIICTDEMFYVIHCMVSGVTLQLHACYKLGRLIY